jgi:hypothetical protein
MASLGDQLQEQQPAQQLPLSQGGSRTKPSHTHVMAVGGSKLPVQADPGALITESGGSSKAEPGGDGGRRVMQRGCQPVSGSRPCRRSRVQSRCGLPCTANNCCVAAAVAEIQPVA